MKKKFPVLLFLLLFGLTALQAIESRDGFIRLNINEKNGSFSVFYLTDQNSGRYVSLFCPRNSGTSYFSVKVDGRVHRLGSSRVFTCRATRINNNPALVFESSFLLVNIIFTPVRTISSPNANGIKVFVQIENKTARDMSVGLRFLADTYLGEGRGNTPFVTNSMMIFRETLIDSSSGETYWISGNREASLMGNIIKLFDDETRAPDFLHFANRQKLNDYPWRAPFRDGGIFTTLPYSIEDSAVCYFWEPAVLSAAQSFTYSIYFTSRDTEWYNLQPSVPRVQTPTIDIPQITSVEIQAQENTEDFHLQALRTILGIIEQFLSGDIILNEQDLLEIEWEINRLESLH